MYLFFSFFFFILRRPPTSTRTDTLFPSRRSSDLLETLLFRLGIFIEKAGTGGGLFRRLLADGCTEIARLTGDPATADLAAAADHCAQAWTDRKHTRLNSSH